jgi:enoyl-CoA hydratase
MSFENLLIEKRGRVAILTINRPDKLNALNIPTRNEILAAFDQLEKDDEVRVVVITGAGEKAFIAGADINEFAGMTAVAQRSRISRSL